MTGLSTTGLMLAIMTYAPILSQLERFSTAAMTLVPVLQSFSLQPDICKPIV